MCSGLGDEENDDLKLMKKDDVKLSIGATCKRCDQKAVVTLRVQDPLCKDCFLSYCTHKYRSTIGKHHQVKHGDFVLLAYSGGPSSSAMLHMVQQALNEEAHKKLYFVPAIIYIDEGSIRDESADDRLKSCQEIHNRACTLDWPCFITTLEMALDLSELNLEVPTSTVSIDMFRKDLVDQLQKTLSSFKTVSAQEEFIWRLKLKLISEVAEKKKFNKVFVGSSATRLSVQLLAAIAQGKGGQIPNETGFIDSRSSVPILRPLREFMSKEIILYNQFNNVHYVNKPTVTTKLQNHASILKLTESFILGLQSEFPATVSTIFRTGDKLSSVLSKNSRDQICPFCKSPVDTTDPERCSAVSSLEVSETLSHDPEDLIKKATRTENCCSQLNECCENTCCKQNVEDLRSDLKSCLCYSCFLLVKEMKDVELLPSYVIENARVQARRNRMKKEIEDFLLPDDN